MIDRTAELPVTRQCQVLQLSRSTVYRPQPELPEADLALMRRIDELHLEYPFLGSRQLRNCLRLEGRLIGRKRIRRLMRLMGIAAIYRKPNTSKRHPQHPVFPYLLRGMTIDRPNQVWAMDITYLPMKRGFVYLAVVLDWATRRVLSFRLSNSLTTDFCIEAVEEAICTPTSPSPLLARPCIATSRSTTPGVRTPRLTDRRPTPCTSTRCRLSWRLNPAEHHL